jgi:hypothetical protein
MRELEKTNSNIVVGNLKSICESIISTECELKKKLLTIDLCTKDELMNELGISGKDNLMVYNLVAQNGSNLDLDLSQCKFIQSKSGGDEGKEELLKVSYQRLPSGQVFRREDYELVFSSVSNFTADSDYIYVYQKDKGLHKFRYSDSVDTRISRLHKQEPGMSDANRYFMYPNGKLYYYTSNSSDYPLSQIDTDTLEETTDNEEFGKKVEVLVKNYEADGNKEQPNKQSTKLRSIKMDNQKNKVRRYFPASSRLKFSKWSTKLTALIYILCM